MNFGTSVSYELTSSTTRVVQLSSVQLLSRVQLFATPQIAARQASRSITNSRSSLKLMSIKSVMPSSHLVLCRPLLLLPPIPPSIRVVSRVKKRKSLDVLCDCGCQMLLVLLYNQSCTMGVLIHRYQRAT